MPSLQLLSWNLNRQNLWDQVRGSAVDIALLQEAALPPEGTRDVIPTEGEWSTSGQWRRKWRTTIVDVSSRAELESVELGTVDDSDSPIMPVSRPGTISAARVVVHGEEILTVVSVYAVWERRHGHKEMWADGSAHRIFADLAPLLYPPKKAVLIAGDFNLLRGYGEKGDRYWAQRYQTVFDRASALGLTCAGPEYPNGRQADPWPDELPRDSKNVPTFRHSRQTPATATRQLDFVFATEPLLDRVHVRALNDPDEWGPSDHCRILIEVSL